MSLYRLHNPGLPKELRFGDLKLTAFSISGLASYVLAPSLNACFDLGHCAAEAARIDNVFLSHVHQDHSSGVPRHLWLREMQGMGRPRVYCPAASAEGLRGVLRAFDAMEGRDCRHDDVVKGVTEGEVIPLGRRHSVRVFDVVHRIASVGYTVVSRRRRLLDAWVGAPGREIGEARARGEAVEVEYEVEALTYVGDSTIETLRRHPEVGRSEVLFLEATHLPGTDPSKSAEYGHTHLDELVTLWRENPDALASPHIVLKHFSMRYFEREVRAAVAALPPGLRERVQPLL
ncbi:MAG: hypothetical protein R3A52_04225 [Polyangiales bacterium]